MQIIETKDVVKSYGPKEVLKGVSINVTKGTVFGLLGPNGAGKTTFVKSLLNIISPDSGKMLIGGIDHNNEQARKAVAYMPEKFSFFHYYSVEKAVLFFGEMHEPGKDLPDRVENALNKAGIFEIKRQQIGTLSKGQLQRVGIAAMLVCNKELFIFDEPFSGLDPIGIKDLKGIIKELHSQGKTVFINSHILSEVEQICSEMAILHQGKCLAQGNINELKGQSNLEDFFYKTIKG